MLGLHLSRQGCSCMAKFTYALFNRAIKAVTVIFEIIENNDIAPRNKAIRSIASSINAQRSHHLKHPSRAHPTTNTHRRTNEFRAATFAFDEGVADETLTAHAVRMANRNRTTVDV